MKLSELNIYISGQSYDEKTAKNYQNWYVAKKRIVSKTSNFFITEIEDLNEDFVKISLSYLIYFSRNKPSKSVTVGMGRAGTGQAGSSFKWFN